MDRNGEAVGIGIVVVKAKTYGTRRNEMPRFDGTGPLGQGPRTGGGFGFCGTGTGRGNLVSNPYRGAGRGLPPWGGGRGRCFGGGRGGRFFGYGGFGRWGIQPVDSVQPTPEQEAAFLKNQAAILEQELAAVKERLDRIESEKGQ